MSFLTVNLSISSPVKLSGQHSFLSTPVFNKQTNKQTSYRQTADHFVEVNGPNHENCRSHHSKRQRVREMIVQRQFHGIPAHHL